MRKLNLFLGSVVTFVAVAYASAQDNATVVGYDLDGELGAPPALIDPAEAMEGIPTLAEAEAAAKKPLTYVKGDLTKQMVDYSGAAVIADRTLKPVTTKARGGASTKSITSIADLEGEVIISYDVAVEISGVLDSGCLSTITAIDGTDSISISDFWEEGATITAYVDLDNMTITIPPQVIGSHTTPGDYGVCAYDADNSTSDWDTGLTGTISDDGIFTIDTAWGIFYTSEDYSSYTGGIYTGMTSAWVNGTMYYTYFDDDDLADAADTIKVAIEQVDNIVYVHNFYGEGATVEIKLLSSKKATIASQVVAYNSTYYAEMSTAAASFETYYSSYYGTVESDIIACDEATEDNVISWGNWTLREVEYCFLIGWDGKIVADFDFEYPEGTELAIEGDGSADSPYLIASADDWNELATYGNENILDFDGIYIKLTDDIDFSSTEIVPFSTVQSYPFKGDFDGNEKTVKGISYVATQDYDGALIRYPGEGGCIHDLTIEGEFESEYQFCGVMSGKPIGATFENITTKVTCTLTGYSCGGLIGYSKDCEFTNCVQAGTITTSSSYSGGLCGVTYDDVFTSCSNTGTIYATAWDVGGVCGQNNTLGASKFYYCHNYGTMYVTSAYNGGVVGLYNTSLSTSTPGLWGCCNYGTIYAFGSKSATYNVCVGGVIGKSYVIVYDCHNYGIVYGEDYFYPSGVVGYNYGGTVRSCTNEGTVTSTYRYPAGVVGASYGGKLINLTNNGNVENTGTGTSGGYAGGVVGYAWEGNSTPTLTNCVNKGTVKGDCMYIGGVIGSSAESCTLTSCGNEGTVSSTARFLGGVLGIAAPGTTMTDCYNTGEVICNTTDTVAFCGGFAGLAYPAEYIDCYNSGTMTVSNSTTGYVAGLFGRTNIYSGYSTYDLSGCYNTADITAYYNVAGIATKSSKDYSYMNLSDCYNTGNITATYDGDDHQGAAAGLLAVYPRGITLTDCYNTGAIDGGCTGSVGGLLGCQRTTQEDEEVNTLTGCYNAGEITSTDCNYTGGLVGHDGGEGATTISESYNLGDVTSATDFSGGIAGYSSTAMTNVYNTGDITGVEYVGGIAGFTSADITTGYTTGTISSTGISYGNVVGLSRGSVSDDFYFLEANDANGTSGGTSLTYAELGALELDGWIAEDAYTYPVLEENDYSLAHAAAVIPLAGDTYSSIQRMFYLGVPDGVTWTASSSVLTIDGKNAEFTETYTGSLTVTATCGDVSVDTELYCVETEVGIDDLKADGRTVVDEQFYTISGQQVAEPADDDKSIYIVVKTYDDGTTAVAKEVR